MAITKQKKVELVASMTERLSDAKSIVFVNFKALPVSETKMLRRKLSADKVGYFVTKKTLAKRVLSDLKAKGEMPELPGELAIAYGDDPLAPARETYAFQTTPRDKGSISIVGGIFEGEYKTKEEMMAIATIPPLQVLRGMFVNLINSPIQRFAIAMGQIAESAGESKGAVPTVASVAEIVAEAIPEVVEVVTETPVVEATPAETPAEVAPEAQLN
ncbi:MAG: 50S ribosomal protein L10 [Parcubacteria group bacterium GW2011_GWC1_42_11]|uniref:Large ribosomal subunit protein uL10 n=1 Tax=Candidatus Nomurabacteria bacterium GW2011_GWC2_42_20 TaxID=1618756 RepID=A0A0G1BLW9_9BACT|nr:MAG: 50S ribosomal protein L10 [Parcubacteria group bacterium GW2011_GWC1_42_11]KKS47266.1 MAG: 50S ribosomal protein L10 [Candidatus Nomurabacteria bacterium GW2011_GWC2_42_20]TAN36589.1 MAG: 50S ribosomal protein L10 [Patescibacteria group bacterium]HBH71246.1 50S ribosomal protein L10 [Candidatus Yonathbacteria bacterium]